MSANTNPNVVTDGLVLCLDNYNEQSYLGEPTQNIAVNFSAWSKDSSGHSSQGVVTLSSDNWTATIVDTDDNTRHYASMSVTAGTTYTFSNKYRNLGGTSPTFAYQYVWRNSSGGTISWAFVSTSTIGITDITGWQTASYTLTAPSGAIDVVWYMQDGADYTGYTHTFEIKEMQFEAKSHMTKWVNTGARSATDGWQDLSGGGNHLSLNQLAYSATNVPGTNVNEFSFDGTDDYAQNISNLNTIDDIFASGGTIEMAVNSTDGEGNLLTKFYPTGWYCQLHSPSGGNTRFRLDHDFDGATNGSWRTGHVIPVGEYTFITATYNRDSTSNDAVIYINGISTTVSELITPAGTAESDAGDRLTIGKNAWSDVTYFEGKIDIVRLYNRTLSATEILQNYNAHKARYGL